MEEICKMSVEELNQAKQELSDYYDRCMAMGAECVYEDWEYKVQEGLIVALKYIGEITEHLKVADWIDCLYCDSPNKVKSRLKTVDLNKVRYVDINTFAETYITSIKADELLYVGQCAFNTCTALREFKADKVVEVDVDAFRKCFNLREVNLPSVTKISSCAFMDCDNLKKADLRNVISIGNYAFAGCDSLEDVNVQDGVILSDAAFRWCSKLKRA